MHVSSQKLLLIALFASVCGSVVTSRPASALPTPGENDVFERRYRGDDEVGDSDRGGGRGGGRGGSSNDNDSRSGGGGRSGGDKSGDKDGDKGGKSKGGKSNSGGGSNTNPSDNNDRFGE